MVDREELTTNVINPSESAYFEQDEFSCDSMNLNLPITEDYYGSEMSLAPPSQGIQELTEMFGELGNQHEESADNQLMTS